MMHLFCEAVIRWQSTVIWNVMVWNNYGQLCQGRVKQLCSFTTAPHMDSDIVSHTTVHNTLLKSTHNGSYNIEQIVLLLVFASAMPTIWSTGNWQEFNTQPLSSRAKSVHVHGDECDASASYPYCHVRNCLTSASFPSLKWLKAAI